MRPRPTKPKTLCEPCGKSYQDMRRHLNGAPHQRKATQQAMSFAKAPAA